MPGPSEPTAPNCADLRELQELGVLQEANRLFFHPLGLAMAWSMPRPGEEGEARVLGFIDSREDPEGFVFVDLSDDDSARKAEAVELLRASHFEARVALFGSHLQPIGSRLP